MLVAQECNQNASVLIYVLPMYFSHALIGLGVEAGQLAIVAAFLPFAYLSRRSWLYPRLVLGAGSFSIVAVASVWLLERSLNVRIFS